MDETIEQQVARLQTGLQSLANAVDELYKLVYAISADIEALQASQAGILTLAPASTHDGEPGK